MRLSGYVPAEQRTIRNGDLTDYGSRITHRAPELERNAWSVYHVYTFMREGKKV